MSYQERDVLSDGLAPYGEPLGYPLTAMLSGQGNIALIERLGMTRSFTLSFHEIDKLAAWKDLKQEEMRRRRQEERAPSA